MQSLISALKSHPCPQPPSPAMFHDCMGFVMSPHFLFSAKMIYLFDISNMSTTSHIFKLLHFCFPQVYSEVCGVLHISSVSSKRKMANNPSKTWTRDKTSKASGMSWNLPHSELLFSLSKWWNMLLSMWIIPITEHCPSWDITWCNYGSKKGGVCLFLVNESQSCLDVSRCSKCW